jgi:D-methionine transport system substrate-binding protein
MKSNKLLPLLVTSLLPLVGCDNPDKIIVVGATPSPHAEILNSQVVQKYIKEQGFKLKIKVYQDYVTPNKALNDGGIDANYFQHIPYLQEEIETKGYNISAVAKIHYEPLNLYSKNEVISYTNAKISIVNDISNVTRAFELLKVFKIIDSYDVTNFNAQHPVYTTTNNVTIQCIDPGLLHHKVEDGELAVIPGNYALTAWGGTKATDYRVLGETEAVAGQKSNIIASRSNDINSEKINVLVGALAQASLGQFIQDSYGPTVVYSFTDIR